MSDEYFYSLCRPRLCEKVKGRKCLRCRKKLERRIASTDFHICSECHQINVNLGAKAEAI